MCCGVDEALSGEDKLRSLVDFSKDSIKNILKKSLRIYASSACYYVLCHDTGSACCFVSIYRRKIADYNMNG